MSARIREQQEKEWADEIPDEEEAQPESYEETYRDGSMKNECWEDRSRD